MNQSTKQRLAYGLLFPLLILTANLLIARRLFVMEYAGNLFSIEGTFIALARRIASGPGIPLWWPLWDCGLPFQNTYLPLLPLATGWFSRLTGHSPGLAYHQVSAAAFCLGPVFVYFAAWAMSRMPIASFFAAWIYSVASPFAVIPGIRHDLGGLRNLRRLQILSVYGEGPHTLTLMFIPLAILFLYMALTYRRWWQPLLAGIFIGLAVLSNAFGAVILLLAAVSLVAVYGNPLVALPIGLLSYLWISPLLPPSVIHVIRVNSPTVDGDYRFTLASLGGVALLAAGFLIAWAVTRRLRWPAHLRFWILVAWLVGGIFLLGVLAQVNVVPQPHRYEVAAEMSLCVVAAFLAADLLRRLPSRARSVLLVLASMLLVVQTRHVVRYGRGINRPAGIVRSDAYRISRWLDANLHGQRVMVSSSHSFYADDFADIPQLHGGHDPMQRNPLIADVIFAIYSGMNAGDHDARNSIVWLKALGAHAITVPGPDSSEYYKPFAHPLKFEGVLPVLWREAGNTIYGVPSRDASLAHVMDTGALVRDRPENGLDVAQAVRYVEAMESPQYPLADWHWDSDQRATIHAVVTPGQVVATQISYHPGWHATADRVPQPTFADGLGLLVVKPACQGPCEISLQFDGGSEWKLTILASITAMLIALLSSIILVRESRKR